MDIVQDGAWAGKAIARRSMLKLAGSGIIAAGLPSGISACAAPAAYVAANPATWEWLATLANSVAASVIANTLENAFSGIFRSWKADTGNRVSGVSKAYPWYSDGICGVTAAPAVMVGLSVSKGGDPLTDGLLVAMQTGRSAVLLPSWAWQGLSMFIDEELHGKHGDDLAEGQQLCGLTLIPSEPRLISGSSPLGTVGYVTYKTATGWVEISRQSSAPRSTVEVLATNLHSQNSAQTSKAYNLPTTVNDS